MAKKSSKNGGRKQKRWFVGASFGPFSLSFGSGTNSSTTGKGKRSLPTAGDEKYNTTGVTATSAVHNTLITYNPLAQITQGTGAGARLGNSIHLDKCSLSGIISTSGEVTKNTVQWRILGVILTKQYNPSASVFGSGVGGTDLFLDSSNPFISLVDPRLAWVLCDEVVKVKPATTTTDDQSVVVLNCPFNKPFEYNSAGNTYGVSANFYWVLIPFVFGGTTGTTVCGSAVFDQTVSFKTVD